MNVGGVSRVAEGLANLADAEVEALLEIHEGVAGPDVLANLIARDHFARPAHEEREHLRRLRREFDQIAVLAKLAAGDVQLERSEA